MKATSTLILSIVLVPVFVACRENREQRTASKPQAAQQRSDYNKDKTQDYAANKPQAQPGAPPAATTDRPSDQYATGEQRSATGEPQSATGQQKTPGATHELEQQRGALEGGSYALAKFSSKDSPNLTGTAKIHDAAMGAARITIELKNAKPGIYTAGIFESSDCSSLSPKGESLGNAGEITIDKDGRGHLDSSITGVKSSFAAIRDWDKKAVALFPKSAKAETSGEAKGEPKSAAPGAKSAETSSGPAACGLLSISHEPETQG